MKSSISEIKPGETFYLHGDKIHYVGCFTDGDEPIHIYWTWGKFKRRRFYQAVPHWQFAIQWEYMEKRGRTVVRRPITDFL